VNNQRIIDFLNEARTFELGATLQYMGHHYMAQGIDAMPFIDEIKDIAIVEMRHAEALAERINYLGGVPTKNTTEIMQGGDLMKMIRDDLGLEEGAIERYRRGIKICEEEGDSTTRLMLEEILAQEEDHANTFQTMLGEQKMMGEAAA